jgi:hypothetical protein
MEDHEGSKFQTQIHKLGDYCTVLFFPLLKKNRTGVRKNNWFFDEHN